MPGVGHLEAFFSIPGSRPYLVAVPTDQDKPTYGTYMISTVTEASQRCVSHVQNSLKADPYVDIGSLLKGYWRLQSHRRFVIYFKKNEAIEPGSPLIRILYDHLFESSYDQYSYHTFSIRTSLLKVFSVVIF